MRAIDFPAFTSWALAVLLLTLRLGPVFALAPPLSLIQAPMRVRVAMALALCASLAAPMTSLLVPNGLSLAIACASELLLGLSIAFALQAAFASLSLAGRMLDIQAGYGLAVIILPGSRTQAPMFGAILTLVAGLIFFANGGHLALLQLIAHTLDGLPLGRIASLGGPDLYIRYFGLVMTLGFAATAAVSLALFLVDIVIAFLSRALPQMNALLLGLQVKTIVTLLMLAVSAGLLGPATLRLTSAAFDFIAAIG